MSEKLEPSPATKVPTRGTADVLDFSAEIVGHLKRAPSDRVTCRHVFGHYYRCNWWAPASTVGFDNPGMHGLTVTMHRVRKSEFLSVRRTKSGLKITLRRTK